MDASLILSCYTSAGSVLLPYLNSASTGLGTAPGYLAIQARQSGKHILQRALSCPPSYSVDLAPDRLTPIFYRMSVLCRYFHVGDKLEHCEALLPKQMLQGGCP